MSTQAKAAHTPGPWNAIGGNVWDSRAIVATGSWEHRSESEREANARLIAAAPEMLAALRLILASGPLANGMRDDGAMDQAREAVAKALA